jgi:antitoxin component YwqK of YwqJK toxin-antitoxin module
VDMRGKYRRGHQNGEWIYYFETGGINRIQNFKNGKLIGRSLTYYPNSNLQSECNYKIVSEDRKGKLQSVPDGKWIFYDKNGKEINRMNYRNGQKQ